MIDYHRRMIGDTGRVTAFARALKQMIVPGESIVADIGSGTGILSFLARRLGAKECILYECGDIMRIAKTLAKENDMTGLRFVTQHSVEVKNPPRADIVVSETLGNFALEEHIIETMNDARVRHLKPGGILLPSRLTQFVAPVSSSRFHREIDTWDLSDFSLDFSAARTVAFNNIYVRTVLPADIFDGETSVKECDVLDFSKENRSERAWEVAWPMRQKGECFGFVLFWEALLAPGITLSTSPFSAPTHWEQVYIPLPQPLAWEGGDTLTLNVTTDTGISAGINVMWRAKVSRASKQIAASPQMDMRAGHVDG